MKLTNFEICLQLLQLVPSFSLSALCCHPCIREIKLITRKVRRFIGNEKYLQNSLEKEPRSEKEPESDQIFKDEDDVPALNRNANHRGLDREGLSAARSKRSRTVGSLDTPENRMKQLKVLFSEAPFQMNGKFVCDFPKCKKILKTMKGILAHKVSYLNVNISLHKTYCFTENGAWGFINNRANRK